MTAKTLDFVCAAVLCTILTLGLWPFHSPRNDVTWLEDRNGLGFGRYGTVIGSGLFETASAHTIEATSSLEIWLQPRSKWGGGVLVSFYDPGDPDRFSLRQSQTELELQAAIRNGRTRPVTLDVEDVFRRGAPRFIAITSGADGIAIYIDGALARRAPQFHLDANQFTGRMIVGDTAGQGDNWRGRMLGLALYNREIAPAQVSKHYQTWTRAGRPEIRDDEGNVALYLFDERAGSVVHDRGHSGVDLSIPETYQVLNQTFLQPFWTEFSMTRSYWSAVVKNVVGFIPFGFCFCARLSMSRRARRAALMTVALGTLTSITIEILQAYLPTRDSGMTDIITNTLGTWVGVMLWRSQAAQAFFAMLQDWNGARSD